MRRSTTMMLAAALCAPLLLTGGTAAVAQPPAVPAAYVSDHVVVRSAADPSAEKSARAQCPPGTRVLGGGVVFEGAPGRIGLITARPVADPGGDYYEGAGREIADDVPSTWSIEVTAICGDAPGLQIRSFSSDVESDPGSGLGGGVGAGCRDGEQLLGGGGHLEPAPGSAARLTQVSLGTSFGSVLAFASAVDGPSRATTYPVCADPIPGFGTDSRDGNPASAQCPAGTRVYGVGFRSGSAVVEGFGPTPDLRGGTASVTAAPGGTGVGVVSLTCARSGSPAGVLTPTAQDFGEQPVGVTGGVQLFALSNTGDAPLRVGESGLGGANPGDFSIAVDECSGRSIRPGDSCELQVLFTPRAAGPRSATLTVVDNADGSPRTATLTGTGAIADVAVRVQATPRLGILVPAIEYRVTVSNAGPNAAQAVRVTASLPARLSGAVSQDCTPSAGQVVCGFTAVPVGGSQQAEFQVPLRLLTLGSVTVTVTRTASTPGDPNPGNDTASARCRVLTPLLVTCP